MLEVAQPSVQPAPARYFPHVDGLRCIAILSVVVFHSGLPIFPGGFVGVDIFFVISGFLIMSGLDREVRSGNVRFGAFYLRRIRRLIPALLPLLITVLAAGAAILTPVALKALAASTLATLVFGSNVYFFTKSDYFATASEMLPLLHTWSLGIEEQFYIIVPALIAAMWRLLGVRYVAGIAVLALTSLALAVVTMQASPVATFYLMPQRAWELLAGGLVGILRDRLSGHSRVREAAAALGLVLIALPIMLYDTTMAFPGLAALPPVAGAAAMIGADLHGRTAVGRLLSTRPMVWIGSLSYALYLWHWPIFVYARLLYHEDLPIFATLALIALTIIMGWFSTRILEDRVQKAFGRRRAWHLLLPTFATAAVIGMAAGAIYVSGGWPSRRPEAQWRAASRDTWRNKDASSCFVRTLNGKEARTTEDIVTGRLCPLGRSGPRLDYLLWGDSHAEAIRAAYDGAGRRLGLSGAFVGEGGCPPLPGIDDRSRGADYDCLSTNRAVLALIQAKRVPLVILHARWVGMYTRSFFVRARDGREIRGDDPLRMTAALIASIEALRANGTRVVVMGAMPEPGYDVPAALVAPTCCRAESLVLHMRAAGQNKAAVINRDVLGPTMHAHGIPFVDPFTIYCPTGNCPVNSGLVPLYYDYRHVSAPGARLFTEAAEQLIAAGGQGAD